MKNKKKLWIVGAVCLLPLGVMAQQVQPLTGTQRLFDDGKQLFLRRDYAAAQQTLSRYMAQQPQASLAEEAAYMLVCTAYELQAPDCISQMQDYLKQYPESRYANRVRSLIASACFYEKNYSETIRTFSGCDLEMLADAERDACTLRLGTAYMETGNLREAAVWFGILKEVSREYRADAVYHLAYIDYVQGRHDAALNGFREVVSTEKYAPLAPYYIADIQLQQGNYRQAAQLASTYLEAYPGQEQAVQMKRVGGEAAYGLGQYGEAAALLEAYRDETEGKPQRKAMYQLGMACFQTGVFSKAAEALGEAAGERDALAQNAYLHAGLAYLQLKDRNRARMAFGQAASMDNDRNIKEQALYNYALCIHETAYSPFAESVTVFEQFLNEFPNSAYAGKVNDYLVEVYMNTRSYEAALQSIAKISRPGDRILEAKQKLLFRMGTQAFAQADFKGAADYFSQSLQWGRYNQQTKADAYYWRGESKYRMEQYREAADDFRTYLEFAPSRQGEEYGLALYNLGYAAFKQKQYPQALTWFMRCTGLEGGPKRNVVADAYNRMGDCHFYARRFDEARGCYARASETDPELGDYSLFQEGFVKGLQRDYAGKIQTLNQLLTAYPSSGYIDDALYEQGRAFVQLEDNENAIKRYTLLVQNFPESALSRKAANEIGLLYYQDDRFSEAIAAYKKVIASYPGSDEARLAQRDLKSIYVDLNKVDEYLTFAATIPGGANFDAGERDLLTYTAAERAYMRGETEEARTGFLRYLQSFPDGASSVDANYYLGLISYNKQLYAEAVTYLNKVMEYPDNKYSGEAMKICAGMASRDKDYARALAIYRRMADRAVSQEDKLEALTGVLRNAWLAGDRAEAVSAASALLVQPKLTPELATEARYYRAKALLAENKQAEAVNDLEVLAKDTRTVYGAEAKYRLAQWYFDSGETGKAEKEVLDYIEVSTPHAYWLARSFVLLADVYEAMDRNLDARQYLLSLQQNYKADDDIAGMIEERLAKLNKKK